MGGAEPYVKFNENARLQRDWTSRGPPSPLDGNQLEEAYMRAHTFLLERVRQLVALGWEKHETDDSLLSCLSHTRVMTTYPGDRQSRVELRLPRTASAWFEVLIPQWKEMFERSDLFITRRRRWRESTPDRYADAYLYVDVEAPLRDIFNFLQCLIPDMLAIIQIDAIDGVGEEEVMQRLPSSRWVDDYAAELRPIFGEERLKNMVQASEGSGCLSRIVPFYTVNEISPPAIRNGGANIAIAKFAWLGIGGARSKAIVVGLLLYGLINLFAQFIL